MINFSAKILFLLSFALSNSCTNSIFFSGVKMAKRLALRKGVRDCGFNASYNSMAANSSIAP